MRDRCRKSWKEYRISCDM